MGFFLKNLEKAFGKNEPFNLLDTYLSPAPIGQHLRSGAVTDLMTPRLPTDERLSFNSELLCFLFFPFLLLFASERI